MTETTHTQSPPLNPARSALERCHRRQDDDQPVAGGALRPRGALQRAMTATSAAQPLSLPPPIGQTMGTWELHTAPAQRRSTRCARAVTGVIVAVLATAAMSACAAGPRSPAAAHNPRGAPHSDAIAVTGRVATGAGPTGIGFGHGLLWVTRDNDTVARVDPATGHTRASTHVGRFPMEVAVGPDSAWIADSAGDTVSQISVDTGRLRRTITVGDQPSAIAVTAGSVWAICTGDGRLFRIDPTNGRVLARIPLGPPPDDPAAIAAGPSGLWVTSLDRAVQINPKTNTIAATVPVPAPAAITVGADAVWVTSMQPARLTRIDPRSHTTNGSFRVGHGPSGVAIAMHRLWVLDNTDSTIAEIDPTSGHTLARVTIGPHSYDIAAGANAIWAQSYGDQAIYKIQRAPATGATTAA